MDHGQIIDAFFYAFFYAFFLCISNYKKTFPIGHYLPCPGTGRQVEDRLDLPNLESRLLIV